MIININGLHYTCENEKQLRKELEKDGIKGADCKTKEFDPETIRIIVDNLIWCVNGHILTKIFNRVPDLFKSK